MNQAEVIWTLLIVVATLAILAKKVDVPYPVLLVIGGLALGCVPGLPPVQLDPDLVFLFLLPPLLYPAAVFTSWRDFRANLSPILLLAIGLVLFTTAFVAVAAGRSCSDGDHEPSAGAAKDRHRFGWRESRQ